MNYPYNIILVIIVGTIVALFRRHKNNKRRKEIAQLRRRQEELLDAEKKKVKYLSILELRRALEPGVEDRQLETFRISIRSALLAIRKLGLSPAITQASSRYTPELQDDAVVFAGELIARNGQDGLGEWAAAALSPDGYMDAIPLECDLGQTGLMAAVENCTTFAGLFPPEWERQWAAGQKAMTVETRSGGTFTV